MNKCKFTYHEMKKNEIFKSMNSSEDQLIRSCFRKKNDLKKPFVGFQQEPVIYLCNFPVIDWVKLGKLSSLVMTIL